MRYSVSVLIYQTHTIWHMRWSVLICRSPGPFQPLYIANRGWKWVWLHQIKSVHIVFIQYYTVEYLYIVSAFFILLRLHVVEKGPLNICIASAARGTLPRASKDGGWKESLITSDNVIELICDSNTSLGSRE